MFNGNEGSVITRTEAATYTGRFTTANPDPDTVRAVFFGKERLQAILDQPDCMGIRVFYALNVDESNTLVCAGALENEDTMATGVIVELGSPCPRVCGDVNF